MTDLENLNRDTFNTSLEDITDEEAKNDIIFSQESIGEQEGRTLEEILAEVQAMDKAKLEITVDDLLEKYKDLKKGIRGAEGNRNTRSTLRSWLGENIKSLERIQRDLKKHSYNNLSTYKARVGELLYYYEHYEQVRELIVLGQQTSDIHTIIDSKQAKYQQRMNEILHDAALKSMLNNDMERY